MKVSRSLKWTRNASMRTRKLSRDMLLFWKRIDKEMVLFNSLLKFIDFIVQFIELRRTVYFKKTSFSSIIVEFSEACLLQSLPQVDDGLYGLYFVRMYFIDAYLSHGY